MISRLRAKLHVDKTLTAHFENKIVLLHAERPYARSQHVDIRRRVVTLRDVRYSVKEADGRSAANRPQINASLVSTTTATPTRQNDLLFRRVAQPADDTAAVDNVPHDRVRP